MKLSTKMHLLLPTLAVATVTAMTATSVKALDFDGDKPAPRSYTSQLEEKSDFETKFDCKKAGGIPHDLVDHNGNQVRTRDSQSIVLCNKQIIVEAPIGNKEGHMTSPASFFNEKPAEEAPTTDATFFGPKEESKPASPTKGKEASFFDQDSNSPDMLRAAEAHTQATIFAGRMFEIINSADPNNPENIVVLRPTPQQNKGSAPSLAPGK